MTRLYQTTDDTAHETRIAAALRDALDVTILRLPMRSPIDMLGVREEAVVYVIEAKHRAHRRGAFPTLWVEVRKAQKLAQAAALFDCAPSRAGLFVVEWHDAIGLVQLDRILRAPQVQGERMNRAGEAPDPCYAVPVTAIEIV